MKKIILVMSLFFSNALLALEVFVPKANNSELEEISKPQSLLKVTRPVIEKKLIQINETSVFYTHSQTGFQQEGSGQGYDTENGLGKGIFVSYERSLMANNALNFNFWINQATFAEPNDIGGKDIEVRRALVSGLYSWKWFKEDLGWHFDIGATALSQDPNSFTSNEKLVPHYLALGPTVAGGVEYQFGQTWKLKSSFALSMPAMFKEYGANSGYHSLSWHYLASLLVEKKINKSLSFTFGFIFEGEEHRFDGEGERGVQDAVVSYSSIAVPVGVSYAF